MTYDPGRAAGHQTSQAWSTLVRADVDAEALATWDADLLREPRVLVPIDVQGYVSAGGGEAMLRLPSPLTPGAPAGAAALEGPPPFSPGEPRERGVCLTWALPDALLRGTLRDPRPAPGAPAPTGATAAGGGLGLPALPDRWVVLRLVAARTSPRVAVRGWVIDAAAAVAWRMPDYPAGPLVAPPAGQSAAPAVPREGLTGAAGGTLTWTAGYDAAFGRFAWHDPLDDLAADPTLGGTLPGGAEDARASYLVVGWWTDPGLDPLDRVRTEGGLAERLAALRWRLARGGGAGIEAEEREGAARKSATAGLPTATRWSPAAVGRAAHLAAGTALSGASGLAAEARAVSAGIRVGAEASALLHGALVGVPLAGVPAGADLRPAPAATRLALGDSLDEVVATLTASALGAAGAQRGALERLLTAFGARLLARIGSPDGVADADEARHAAAFTSVDPGEPPETDRVRTGRARIPPRARRIAGAPAEPGRVTLRFSQRRTHGYLVAEARAQTAAQRPASASHPVVPPPPDDPGEQVVERPAPRRYVPSAPVLAVRGAGRSLRHGGDGRWSPDGRLGVRTPSQVVRSYAGTVRGADLLPSLGSGALPPETLLLAREVLLLSPHLAGWLARAAAAGAHQAAESAVLGRLRAEMALRYDATGAYTAGSGLGASAQARPAAVSGAAPAHPRLAAERLRRHSLLEGVEPDPVGITSWAQPWMPLWLEYEVRMATAAAPGELEGWRLGTVDAELADPAALPDTPAPRTVAARVPLTTGPAESLAGGLARYVADEEERDRHAAGEVDAVVLARLHALAAAAGSLDLMGAAMDGVRPALLGLPPSVVRLRDAAGAVRRPTPADAPWLATAGTLTLLRARVVDAFGRTLALDPGSAAVPIRLEVRDAPATILRRPRLSAPTRCRLRLVGAGTRTPQGAVPARVDEIDAGAQVNPVAGFLLPDHVDESVELFAADGTPLGELRVEAVGGGVVWEPGPGRALPYDAPPHAGLAPEQAALGHLAAGVVTADARARQGLSAADAAPAESALSAFLRAIDTTLWTVDPVAGAGTSAIAGIVGRPVAVVAATLLLDVADDLDDLAMDAAGRAAREAAYRDLARLEFPVRLGELTRTDDGLLGYYLDGDFTRVRLVDRAVADLAREGGRGRGHLVTWGETPALPGVDPILHPYLHADDEVRLRPGIPRLVTLLMLPGAAVHVTSGVVPRQKIRLSRAWFAPGLERLAPSIRVGPVLVDPGEVRLPLVAALGDRQTFTSREGPLGWRNDAILAATQSAALPDRSLVLREGWIRVTPEGGGGDAGPGGAG